MANSNTRNVIKVDTTATFSGQLFIQSIKYIGSSSGSAIVTCAGSSERLWQDSGSSNAYNADVCIKATQGVTVTIANGAVAYLYLK